MTIQNIEQIPLDACHRYVGVPVCAVLQDGTHFYGVLGGMEGGKLYLQSTRQGPGSLSISATKAKHQLQSVKKGAKASTKAFGYPYGYGYGFGGAYALDVALIALLFALPFFFV